MKRTNTAVWMEKQRRWQIKVQKDGERRSFYSSKPDRTGQREANAWLDGSSKQTAEKLTHILGKAIKKPSGL